MMLLDTPTIDGVGDLDGSSATDGPAQTATTAGDVTIGLGSNGSETA